MKNLVRAFVLTLVATGAVASLHATNNTVSSSMSTKLSAPPVPTCPPDDPNGCGIGAVGSSSTK